MKILRDITIEGYLNYLNSENKTFRKYYSDGMNLNADSYRKLFTEQELLMEMIGVDDSAAPSLKESSAAVDDFENSRMIFEWLEGLSLADANDPRLWTTLTHVNYEDYTRTRWSIDKKSTNETIKQRYFYVGGGMQARLRNAVSRLWWIPKLTVREDLSDKYTYTRIVWSSQDLMQNLFERSLGTYTSVRFALLRFFCERSKIYDSKQFRVFYKEVNALGAITPLSLLSEEEVYKYLHKIEKLYFGSNPVIPELGTEPEKYTLADNKNKTEDLEVVAAESKVSYDPEEDKETGAVYIKKIVPQDLDRTPSIGVTAAEDFFKVKLANGENCTVKCQYKNDEFSVELNKRKTRNEYRFFINRFRDEIGFDVDDLLVFSDTGKSFRIELISAHYSIKQDPRYSKYDNLLGNKKHVIYSNN